MPDSTNTQQSGRPPGDPDTVQEEGSPGLWFALACLVVPILWGIIVHAVFRRLRSLRTPTGDDADSVWPDYQI